MSIVLSVLINAVMGLVLFFGFLFLSLVLLAVVEYETLAVSFHRALEYIMCNGRGFFEAKNQEARRVELGCRIRIALLASIIEMVVLAVIILLIVRFGVQTWWLSFGLGAVSIRISLGFQTMILMMGVAWGLVSQVACMDTKLLVFGRYVDGSYCDETRMAYYTNVFVGEGEPDCVDFELDEREDIQERYCDKSCFFAIMRDPNGESTYISSLSIYA